MTPFDELTLGEVEVLTRDCLGGSSFADADPMQLAGAVMFMTRRREDPTLEWEPFKASVRMFEIKEFSELMNEETLDPTNGVKN